MKEIVGQGQVTLAPDGHLLQPLLEHARRSPTKPLFSRRVGDRFESLSAEQVVQTVRRIARGLISLGIEPGQRVGLMSKTRMEWVLLDFAILAAGAVTASAAPTASSPRSRRFECILTPWIRGTINCRSRKTPQKPAEKEYQSVCRDS